MGLTLRLSGLEDIRETFQTKGWQYDDLGAATVMRICMHHCVNGLEEWMKRGDDIVIP